MIRQWDIVSEIEKSAQDRLQFLGLPKFHPAEAYRVAIGRTVDRLSRYPEIAAIYQIGGISTPGISDIDLVVVFRDDLTSFRPSIRLLDCELDRYLFMHGLFGMPVRVFRQRSLLIPMNQPTLLHGESIPVDAETGRGEMLIASSMYAVEYVIVRLFDLARQFRAQSLRVRSLLCALNALQYDFQILASFLTDDSWQEFHQKLVQVRSHWFEDEAVSLASFFGLCRWMPRLALQLLEGLLEVGAAPMGLLTDMQVGTSGYLRVPQAQSARATLHGRERVWGNAETLPSALPMPRVLKKQMSDWQEASVAFVLTLARPSVASTVSASLAEGALGLEKRDRLLADYSRFMRERVGPEFGLLDVLRWQPGRSRKWDAIRAANRLAVGRGV
jgi:hypothetical protein